MPELADSVFLALTGASRTHFSMMQNVQKGQGFFEAVKAKQPAFMCINDDIKDEDVTSHNKTLQAWHKRTFRKKTEYEV